MVRSAQMLIRYIHLESLKMGLLLAYRWYGTLLHCTKIFFLFTYFLSMVDRETKSYRLGIKIESQNKELIKL